MLRFGLTIFLSACLLFQVQPLIAKAILPWFGGTAAVWTACMLFFQTGLLVGYGYAHALRRWLTPLRGWQLHCCVLAAAVLFCNPIPADLWQPQGSESLNFGVWAVLIGTIGLPFVALSATSPLVQAWHSAAGAPGSTYSLYALSNAGSLLALITFPVLIEPVLTTTQQGLVWQVGFGLFVVLCILSGYQVVGKKSWNQTVTEQKRPTDGDEPESSRYPIEQLRPLTWRRISSSSLAWLGLALIGSVMLLATTNLLCQEIASVPMLWVAPLSLYLLTFIICFDYPRLYQRWLFVPLLAGSASLAVMVVLFNVFAGVGLQIGALLAACFAATMTCHGELERLKPPASELTKYYFILALGGALGGLLVAVLAPRVFDGFYEFHLGLLASLLVLVVTCYFSLRDVSQSSPGGNWRTLGIWSGLTLLLFALAIVASSLYYLVDPSFKPDEIYRERNEYGLLAVEEKQGYRKFIHGRIEHGGEFIADEAPDYGSYYQPGSGVEISVSAFRQCRSAVPGLGQAGAPAGDSQTVVPIVDQAQGLQIGVVGLGVGGMLAWGQSGDRFTFFELDPAVERIAKEYFSYFRRTSAATEVIIGDGRIQLARRAKRMALLDSQSAPPSQFDLLFLDAFSSDSIPIHLMTSESFEIYAENLVENGVLIAHITNRFVDLRPVVYHQAQEIGLTPVLIETAKGETSPPTRWVLMTRNPNLLKQFQLHPNRVNWPADLKPIRWTDDRASLFDVIQWSGQIDWTPILDSRNRNLQSQPETTIPSRGRP